MTASADHPSAVVVGAGVFGASLALRLVREGWRVTLVDRHPPGHVRAASGGESRLMRFSHGEDRWYTRSAWRSRELWRDLEEQTGERLLVPAGVAWFARTESGWEAASEAVLDEEGIPVERLAVADAAALFPSFAGEDLAFVLHEPEAGLLRARWATVALVERARAEGAMFVAGTARPDGDGAVVEGEHLAADRVVWASGGWLPGLFPDVVRARVTRQDVLLFGGDAAWATPPVPGWVDYDGAVYGCGDLDGEGFKCAPDMEGPEIDPETVSRVPAPGDERAAREYLAHRFPALAAAPLVGGKVCQYAVTVDSHFIAAPHPGRERTWLLGGDSGHGFKHGPALAEHVADVLAGRSEPEPRLALGDRVPGRSLRTAGGAGEAGPVRRDS